MKKILLMFFGAASMFSAGLLRAQTAATFTVQSAPSDTVFVTPFAEAFSPTNNIKIFTSSNLTIRWQVNASNFPSDWLTTAALGICDLQLCRSNASGQIWDCTSGSFFNSTYGANSTHDSVGLFDLTMDLTNATTIGSHYITIKLTDMGSSYTKNITFVLTKIPTLVPTVPGTSSNVTLYRNH